MDMGFRFGLMVQNMKGNGFPIRLKVKEHFGMQKVMCMKENFKKIKQMVMVYTLM
jgi:hypothetical protein